MEGDEDLRRETRDLPRLGFWRKAGVCLARLSFTDARNCRGKTHCERALTNLESGNRPSQRFPLNSLKYKEIASSNSSEQPKAASALPATSTIPSQTRGSSQRPKTYPIASPAMAVSMTPLQSPPSERQLSNLPSARNTNPSRQTNRPLISTKTAVISF